MGAGEGAGGFEVKREVRVGKKEVGGGGPDTRTPCLLSDGVTEQC